MKLPDVAKDLDTSTEAMYARVAETMPLNLNLRAVHQFSMHNRMGLRKADTAGCYFCRAIFEVSKVDQWTDDGDTALCPHCKIDTVLADKAYGFDVTAELLSAMHALWFAP